jgi:hypothetical protein
MSQSTENLDFGKLDGYSKRFSEYLFSIFPEWKRFATTEKDEFTGNWYVQVEIPSPLHDSQRNLCISTFNEEITVGNEKFHTHFCYGESEQVDFHDAIEFIKSILDEKILFAISFNDDKWAGSESFELGEEPSSVEGVNVQIQSWKGTYDRECLRSRKT